MAMCTEKDCREFNCNMCSCGDCTNWQEVPELYDFQNGTAWGVCQVSGSEFPYGAGGPACELFNR